MCKAMEEMRNEAARQAQFETRLTDIRKLMEKLGLTKEKALEIYDVPASEYPRYSTALV